MAFAVHSFALNTRIIFGNDALRELPEAGKSFGSTVLVVTGQTSAMLNNVLTRVRNMLTAAEITPVVFAEISSEPTLDMIGRGLTLARREQVDWVIGLGGGSAMDAAKAIAGLYHAPEEPRYYFEGGSIETAGLPLIAIPTTAGSGAEVTPNAVLSDPKRGIKQSIRDPKLAARLALVDPQLTVSLPPELTAYSGMDALVQAIEVFTSKGANPLSDIYAYSAIERIGANLLKAFQNSADGDARTELALGSLMAGVALSNAQLGAVHGLAHSIGIRTGRPHGLVCAVLLVPVMRFNMPVSFERYALVGKALGHNILGMDPIDAAAQGIKTIMALMKKLGIPPHIRSLGVTEADLPAIVAASLPSGSLEANPREAKAEDLRNILLENF